MPKSAGTLETIATGVDSDTDDTDDTLEAKPSTGNNSVLSSTPTEEELRVVQFVKQLFYRARDARRPLAAQWKLNYAILNLKQNQHNRNGLLNPSLPHIWPVTASINAWMTDQRPTIEVTPSAQPFSQFADYYQKLANDMNVALNATFTVNDLNNEITKMLWDTLTYGIGYIKTVWEPWLADGLGDAVFRRVDPFTLYPDPLARSYSDLWYIIEAKQMTVEDVKRSYPGSHIHAEMMEDAEEAPHRLDTTTSLSQPRANYAAFSPGTSTRYMVTNRGTGMTYESPIVTVLECWYKSYKVEEDEDGDARNGTAKVIENWNCAVVCGNRVLLHADANEINSHGQHPYDRNVLFDTGEWYGPSLVEFMASAQESINRVLTQIEYNLALMGNPILAEAPASASRNHRITNRPGQRIQARPDQVGFVAPPQIQPQLAVQLVQYYESKIESISGMSAIVRGFSPTGRNAQGVMDSVQDAAFVRIRASLRQLELCLRGACSKMVATIAEFYTEPRLITLIGPDGKRTNEILRANHFYTPDSGKEWNDPETPQLPMRFNLLADAGSQLPTSRQARSADAETMYALGAIDELELLKAKQWPNYAVVAERVMSMKAQQGMLGQPPGARQRTRA
jgi:hypothetical protein